MALLRRLGRSLSQRTTSVLRQSPTGFLAQRVPSRHHYRCPAHPIGVAPRQLRRGVGSEEAPIEGLASVRRSNGTCGFPAYRFHKAARGHAVIDEAVVRHGNEVGLPAPDADQSGAGAHGWSMLRGDATGLGEGLGQRPEPPSHHLAHAAIRVCLERVGEVPEQQVAAKPRRRSPMRASPFAAQGGEVHRLQRGQPDQQYRRETPSAGLGSSANNEAHIAGNSLIN